MTKDPKFTGVRAKFQKHMDDHSGTTSITLKESGVSCEIPNFINHGRWMRAQRIAAGDSAKAQTAFVCETVRFEGEKLTITDLQELVPAADVLQLVNEIFGEDDDQDMAGNEQAA